MQGLKALIDAAPDPDQRVAHIMQAMQTSLGCKADHFDQLDAACAKIADEIAHQASIQDQQKTPEGEAAAKLPQETVPVADSAPVELPPPNEPVTE